MIEDGFSRRKKRVSRQRLWQLRKLREGRCTRCGQPAVLKGHCLKHAVAHREYQRRKLGCKRRLKSKTYRLEKNHEPHH